MSKENRQVFEFGPFRIDTVNRQLMRDGEVVPLKAKAVDTLLLLIGSRGDVIEKDELMQRLWPDSFVEEANLTQNIYTLRKALGEGDYIETIPRRGYRFVAPVKEKDGALQDVIVIKERTSTRVSYEEEDDRVADEARLIASGNVIDVTPAAVRQLPAASRPQTSHRWLWLSLALLVLIVVAVVVITW